MNETLIRLTREQRSILREFLAGRCFYKHDTLHAAGLLGRGLLRLTIAGRSTSRGAGGWYEITAAGRSALEAGYE